MTHLKASDLPTNVSMQTLRHDVNPTNWTPRSEVVSVQSSGFPSKVGREKEVDRDLNTNEHIRGSYLWIPLDQLIDGKIPL